MMRKNAASITRWRQNWLQEGGNSSAGISTMRRGLCRGISERCF